VKLKATTRGRAWRPVTALPQALAGYAVEFGCDFHLQRVFVLLQDVSGAANTGPGTGSRTTPSYSPDSHLCLTVRRYPADVR
jgi:hypothetical protein